MKSTQFKFLLFFLAIFATIGLAACNATAEEDHAEEWIAKSWRLQSMTDHGESVPLNVLINSSFTFNKNGRYEILLGQLDKGTWKLSEDKKVLLTYPDGMNMENEMDIESITETQLILKNQAEGADVRFVMVPM